ncbi:hypothetical protein Cni_G24223 [Canna indica]|uniref:Uncharacterized protein n=1 Tax=Canna indica TaxID=4628 RepID=A0AAQ3KXL6_9LILI|nr:hypothetical protein Cni_G24223 [Canna indica]
MEMAIRITRSSITAFSNGYHSFTSIAALLVLPCSASLLLSQALVTTSTTTLQTISARCWSLFRAARFPASAELISLLSAKISQTIFAFVFTLPFVLTLLLLAKSCIVLIIRSDGAGRRRKADGAGLPPLSSLLAAYRSVLPTHLFNSFVLLSASSGTLALLCIAFNAGDALGIPSSVSGFAAAGAVLYAVVVANATVICNMAVVVSAMDDCGGCLALLKAGLLVRGRVATALCLALPANLGMAAVEALFQYRVVREYNLVGKMSSSLVWEAFSIAYIHALLVVLDVIMSCMFFKSCRRDLILNCDPHHHHHHHHHHQLEQEGKAHFTV